MREKRFKRLILACLAIAVFITSISVAFTTLAYFTTKVKVYTNDGNEEYAHIGMRLNLLFDRLDSTEISFNTDLLIPNNSGSNDPYNNGTTANNATTFHYDENATWGTAQNPYIISNIKHLQNLSALQNVGYFDELHASFNTSQNGTTSIPYFLVCKPDGSPVTIDGTGKTIEPIGTDDHPFIGFVGGAFKEGTTSPEAVSTTSDDSVLYNISVSTNPDNLDVGLFGTVGYLGDDSDVGQVINAETINYFVGGVTTLTNLVLFDVQIKVENQSFIKKISTLLIGHRQSTTESHPADHHIGILAGHVEYAIVKYISVYYSDLDVTAIDISQTTKDAENKEANYGSQSGILGFIYNFNPTVQNNKIYPDEAANSNLVVDDSTGSGGGLLSGEGRGYVTARKIYNLYDDSGEIVKYNLEINEINGEVEYYSLLVVKSGNNYYLAKYNGSTYVARTDSPVTVDVGNTASVVETYRNFWNQQRTRTTTWSDFVVFDGTNYYHKGVTNPPEGDNYQVTGPVTQTKLLIRYGYNYQEDEVLCTQWIRQRILFGTQATGEYYFTDGVFTFALSDNKDVIENTWVGDVADTFSVGVNDNSGWKKNISKGMRSITAYIRKIKDNEDLAQNANRPLIILAKDERKRDGMGVFLMTLNTPSDTSTFSTGGMLLEMADTEYIDTLVNGYASGEIDSLPTFTGTNYSTDQVVTNLQDGTWTAINVGKGEDLSSLINNYKIKATTTSTKFFAMAENGEYSNVKVSLNKSGNSYTGSGSYDVYTTGNTSVQWSTPYFYIDYTTNWLGTNVTFHIYTSSGTAIWDSGTYRQSTAAQGQAAAIAQAQNYATNQPLQYGQTIYSYTRNNTTTTGILLMRSHDSNNYSLVDGTSVTITGNTIRPTNRDEFTYKSNTYTFDKFFYKSSNGNYYYYNGTQLNGEPQKVMNGDNHVAVGGPNQSQYYYQYTYTQNGVTYTGAYVKEYSNFILSNIDNSYRQYLVTIDTSTGNCDVSFDYNLYCGSNPGSINNIDAYEDECSIFFDNNGNCYIQYTNNDTNISRYVYYDGGAANSEDGSFKGGASSTTLEIYVLEATQNTKFGHVTYDAVTPIDGTANPTVLSADHYVLWPSSNSTVNQAQTPDPSYYVVNINNLKDMEYSYYNKTGDVINGWLSGDGESTLTYNDLHKKFAMQKGITTAAALSLLNGTLNTGGYITAPVGSLGVEANIPQGSVAFRVNKSDINYYVRVIVSVPVSTSYRGEEGSTDQLNWNNDYYLALWHPEAAGDQLITIFQSTNCQEKIELPRSNPYDPDKYIDDPDSNYITTIYDANGNGVYDSNERNYRTYLNGNHILVAYAFQVSEEGVYVLGAANSNTSGDDTANFPMEIVYFSVDGTASAGRDGAMGSYLGTVDFVYSANGKILTVTDQSDDGGVTDYNNNYYASLVRLYTKTPEEAAIDLNQLKITIKRKIDGGQPTMFLTTQGDDYQYLIMSRYNQGSDRTGRKDPGDTGYTYEP